MGTMWRSLARQDKGRESDVVELLCTKGAAVWQCNLRGPSSSQDVRVLDVIVCLGPLRQHDSQALAHRRPEEASGHTVSAD